MEESGGIGVVGGVIYVAFMVLMIASMWKINVKAGQPGWACLIPFYNVYILLKIVNRPGWWLVLFLIPFVNFVVLILMMIGLAKVFGKGGGFAAGLIFLPFIFLPMLAFGDAQYQGSASASGMTVSPA